LAKYEPVMTPNGIRVQVNRHPKFLGVKFDALLHFTEMPGVSQRRLRLRDD